jgi:hypothetical protein
MTNEEMKQKIEDICEELGIQYEWITADDNCANRIQKKVNCANRLQKKVWVNKITDTGDYVVALHEIGHVECDPNEERTTYREKLDAETKAWQWALERNNGNFDAQGWKRLHESLWQYYRSVMDPSHSAHQLLMEAERQNQDIRPRVSSFGAPSSASFHRSKGSGRKR